MTEGRLRVGIVLFNDIEVLDFCGPFEVFSVVRLDEANRRTTASPYEVITVAEHAGVITATGGLRVLPDVTFDSCPALDILLVPGGWGTRTELANPALLTFLQTRAPGVRTLASVCTGALLLGHAGLLDGKHATTHWKALELMQASLPAVHVDATRHFVRDGAIYTAAGISAGIDMALRIVAEHHGEALARATAKYMEYPYPEHDRRRITV